MMQWHEYSYLSETCGNVHCKYFTINGCTHPNVKYCENASLYWPWQIHYSEGDCIFPEVTIRKEE